MSQEWQLLATAPKDRYIWGYDPGLKRPFEMIWNVPANAFVATHGLGDEMPTHWIDFPPLPTAVFSKPQTRFYVGLEMESGEKIRWTGMADDQNHAEGQAIAEAVEKTGEQVMRLLQIGTKAF